MLINDEAALQSLINSETPESGLLEYKAAAAISNAKEITKDVSSMANGAGGIIIYGLTEQDNKPGKLDPIKEKKYSREYLDQVIALGIQPPIKFKTEPIQYDGGNIFVVHIEPGETAHMSLGQNRYYRRYNFIAVAMEDYEIRDIMNRSKNPKVIAKFFIMKGSLHTTLFNEGIVYAKHVNCILEIPTDVLRDGVRGRETMIYEFKDLGVIHPQSGLALPSHVFTKQIQHNIYYSFDSEALHLSIKWRVFADNALNEGSEVILGLEVKDSSSYLA